MYWTDTDFAIERELEALTFDSLARWKTVSGISRPSTHSIPGSGWNFQEGFLGFSSVPRFECRRSSPPRLPAGLADASLLAKSRWRKDGFVLSPLFYEDSQLLWRGSEYRPVQPYEILRAMGYHHCGYETRPSELSCLPLVCILDRLMQNILVSCGLTLPRKDTTRFHPVSGLGWPNPKKPDILDDLRYTAERLADEDSSLIDCFNTFLRNKGRNPCALGPDPEHADRSTTNAAMYTQSGLYFSKHGAPALLPHYLNVLEHVERAQSLEHPMGKPPALPLDMEFALRTVAKLGNKLPQWRSERMKQLRRLSRTSTHN